MQAAIRYDSRRYALLNRWDPRHLRTVQRLLAPRADERVLEVGCGRGHLTKALAELGIDVTGVDANPQAAEVAVSQRVQTMRAERLQLPDDSFDAVVSVHALEHVLPIEKALAEMARVLRPGGRLLLVYPAEPVKGLFAIPTSIILYRTPFRARQIHCHRITPRRLRRMTDPLGLLHERSELHLWRSPEFATLLTKPRIPSL
jgi:ubiquinone/menaquinone biosynthesis C-methylase UbiE